MDIKGLGTASFITRQPGLPLFRYYCLSSIDKNVRFRSLELVIDGAVLFPGGRVPQVKFVDRNL